MQSKEEKIAASKIRTFFTSSRFKKQKMAKKGIENSLASKLLRAFDLRFQCMRAVAAAKFPINKPIEDAEQAARVIASIRAIAKEKNIPNLDAVERLFCQNILLAERIQHTYHSIWRNSYTSGVDNQSLVDNAYAQLCQIVKTFKLPIEMKANNSSHVLPLARKIIEHASEAIIAVLSESELVLKAVSQEELSDTFSQILALYMSQNFLSQSKENIQIMVQEMNVCVSEFRA